MLFQYSWKMLKFFILSQLIVSGRHVNKKKSNINDYLLNLSTSGTPLDEIGLMMVDHMYKLNICVMMKDHFWCSLNTYSGGCTDSFGFQGQVTI